MGRLIGYARVSTLDQSLDLQIDDLNATGCKRIVSNKISGVRTERLGFDELLKALRAGDTLRLWRLERLGRAMPHLATSLIIHGYKILLRECMLQKLSPNLHNLT